jgi:hypothetical protein
MPTDDFEWMLAELVAKRDWSKMPDDSEEKGYILEVDLDYPPELHEAHNTMPLAPEHLTITEDNLSPYSRRCLEMLRGAGAKHRSDKLATTFLPKRNYVIHASNLALYLQLGMKLVRVHRVIQFRQSTFLKTYIEFCTRKRFVILCKRRLRQLH